MTICNDGAHVRNSNEGLNTRDDHALGTVESRAGDIDLQLREIRPTGPLEIGLGEPAGEKAPLWSDAPPFCNPLGGTHFVSCCFISVLIRTALGGAYQVQWIYVPNSCHVRGRLALASAEAVEPFGPE